MTSFFKFCSRWNLFTNRCKFFLSSFFKYDSISFNIDIKTSSVLGRKGRKIWNKLNKVMQDQMIYGNENNRSFTAINDLRSTLWRIGVSIFNQARMQRIIGCEIHWMGYDRIFDNSFISRSIIFHLISEIVQVNNFEMFCVMKIFI